MGDNNFQPRPACEICNDTRQVPVYGFNCTGGIRVQHYNPCVCVFPFTPEQLKAFKVYTDTFDRPRRKPSSKRS